MIKLEHVVLASPEQMEFIMNTLIVRVKNGSFYDTKTKTKTNS